VILQATPQGSGSSGFFILAITNCRSKSANALSPLNAAEGRCNRMKLRDWIELLRIQLNREEGQTMAEYGVVLAVITVGVVLAISTLALAISGKLGDVTGVLNG
jgi:Flp pilus assembly pilin Flp